jgi:hypothetical protein
VAVVDAPSPRTVVGGELQWSPGGDGVRFEGILKF